MTRGGAPQGPSASLRRLTAESARPVVHIGYHKTATTWFQQHVYPAATSHRWIPRSLARHALLDPWGLAFDPETARRQLGDPHDPRPPVICEENLSGYLHNGGLHGMIAPEVARRIKAVLPDARIVIVIRAQASAIAASYVQYVRGGGTHGPTRYLHPARFLTGARRHAYKAPGFAFEHFEYDRLIVHYDALFGPQNVLVLPFEALRVDPRSFLTAYAHAAGLQLGAGDVTALRPNRSFGQATLLAGRLTGLLTSRSVTHKACLISIPGFYEVRRQLLKLMSRFDRAASPAAILGARNLSLIQDHFAQSNARTARLRDLDLSALGYPVSPKVAEDQPAPSAGSLYRPSWKSVVGR